MTKRFFGSKEGESGAGTEETRPPLRSLGPGVDSRTYPESGDPMLVDTSHRGVWIAPWQGPNGELVLFAMGSHNRLVTDPMVVPAGSDHVAAADMLWDLIDEVDTQHPSFIGRPPRFRRVRRSRLRRFSGLGIKIVD